jgi:general stress protein YciG
MTDKRKRGFAAMDPETHRQVARRGGRTAHGRGTAYTFTQEDRRKGGERGGRAVSRDSAYMAEIGRKGGEKSRKVRDKPKEPNKKGQRAATLTGPKGKNET